MTSISNNTVPNIQRGRELIFNAFVAKNWVVESIFKNALNEFGNDYLNFIEQKYVYNCVHCMFVINCEGEYYDVKDAERTKEIVLQRQNQIMTEIAENICHKFNYQSNEQENIAAYLCTKVQKGRGNGEVNDLSQFGISSSMSPRFLKFCGKIFEGKMLSNAEKAKKHVDDEVDQKLAGAKKTSPYLGQTGYTAVRISTVATAASIAPPVALVSNPNAK